MLTTGPRSAPTRPIILSERWRSYTRTGDLRARDELVLAYSPLVKRIAGRVAARMPAHIELADLVSYGLAGLIDAVERFVPVAGATFETYAGLRIRGAIVDELRRLDWVPRAVRDEARDIDDASTALVTTLQRLPTDAELAAELEICRKELDVRRQRVARSVVDALDKPLGLSGDGDFSLLDSLCDEGAGDPAVIADVRDLRRRIWSAIERLPERERTIFTLRHVHDLELLQIGAIVGLSQSRICQILAETARRLERTLRDDDRPPAAAPPSRRTDSRAMVGAAGPH